MSASPLNLYDVDDYSASKKGQVTANYAGDSVEVEYRFSILDGPTTSTTDTSIHTIPAGALIEDFDVFVEEALTGGTNFSFGLAETDGTAIDADGLLAASTTLTAGYQAGDGAVIGTVADAANEAQLTLGTTGSFTAGVIKVVLKYKKA